MTMPLSLSSFLEHPERAPLIIAHRGDWQDHPENSLAAITGAAAKGSDMAEIDVQRSRDGVLVLLHDDTLDRTTTGTGPIAEHDLAELRQLSLRSGLGGADAAVTAHRMPTLIEALEAAKNRIFLNIDTKTQQDLDQVCAEVLARGMADQVLVKGPVDQPSDMMRFLDAPWWGKVAFMPVMLTIPRGELVKTVLTTVHAMNLRLVELDFHDTDELRELAGHMKAENVWIWLNTLDPVHSLHYSDRAALEAPEAIWGELVSMGVRAIQTDHSGTLAELKGRI